MPFINIKTNVKSDKAVKEKIIKQVLENTSTILRKNPKVTSTLVEFLSFDSWTIKQENKHTFYLDIKITKGTNTKEEKANYIQKTFSDLENILGDIAPASYILIDEIDASSWGFDGMTQEYRHSKTN